MLLTWDTADTLNDKSEDIETGGLGLVVGLHKRQLHEAVGTADT